MKRFEDFGLDTANECLWREGAQIALAPKPFAVLRYLVEHPGRLITHDELLDALWPETYVQPQVLRTYVLELRKLLGDDPVHPRFIQTLPKRGYSFVAKVSENPDGAGRRKSDASFATKPATTVVGAEPAVPAVLVGRDAELGHLLAVAGQLGTGSRQRRVVFVTGEAGIGKSALVDAFCRLPAASIQGTTQPVRIARGQCVEGFGRKEEYYPIMEALGQLCSSPDGEEACRTLARMAPMWMAALGREPGDAARQAAQERMPGDLCVALEGLAADRPLVLIFEDLHWADDATLHLISALARRRATAQLMVVATYRPHDAAAEHLLKALKQDLLMRRLCTEIALAPLSRAAVRELLSRELKQEELPPGLAVFVHQHSEGNPLFVIAIVEHLIAEKFLVRVGVDGKERWTQRAAFQEMESGVPDGLAQMIELEIERLTPEEQRIVEAGSLVSVAFPAWMVAAALDGDLAETEEACDHLAKRIYFVERAGQDELPDGTRSAFYVFAHGLYREVLYRRQSASRRARRHLRVAERLGQLFTGREADVAREMAMHYEAAGHWRRAIDAHCLAARQAGVRQAHAEAAEMLEQALRAAENLANGERAAATAQIYEELGKMREILEAQQRVLVLGKA